MKRHSSQSSPITQGIHCAHFRAIETFLIRWEVCGGPKLGTSPGAVGLAFGSAVGLLAASFELPAAFGWAAASRSAPTQRPKATPVAPERRKKTQRKRCMRRCYANAFWARSECKTDLRLGRLDESPFSKDIRQLSRLQYHGSPKNAMERGMRVSLIASFWMRQLILSSF